MKIIRPQNRITSKDTDSFKFYLQEITSIKMFTYEEEAECSKRAIDGDAKAKDELIRRNLRFVVTVAKQYESSQIPLEDLVNEGNIGLIMAADRYRLDTGFRFITYAVYWIRKVIYEYISNNTKMIRIPSHKVSIQSKFNQKASELEQVHGRAVDMYEVLEELEKTITVKEIQSFERYSTMKIDSLDTTIDDDTESTLYDTIVDDSILPPDFEFKLSDIKFKVDVLLNKLKDRDKQIMKKLYGLDCESPLTLEQVAQEYNLSREAVRQIKEKSLKTIKDNVKKGDI